MTPMFQQYHELKAAQPNALLFFRMGDFYEMFFDDAVVAARELELTLTSRNKDDPDPVPMCGVPYHAADRYVQRLLAAGFRVAIAEQVEDPALAKGIVRRAITRVVTPGVVLDDGALQASAGNYLLALCGGDGAFGLAWLDVSTGDLRATTVPDLDTALSELHRVEPREALLEGPLATDPVVLAACRRHGAVVSTVEPEAWQPREALRELKTSLAVRDISAFGLDPDAEAVRAAGAVVRYARDLTGGELRNVHAVHAYDVAAFMVIDDATRRNLELFRTLVGGRRKGSLLGLLDRTSTAMGARLLREWLSFPLLDVAAIRARHAAVAVLVDTPDRRERLRDALKRIADLERIVARTTAGTATPRDLGALRDSLVAVPDVLATVADLDGVEAHVTVDDCADLAAELSTWLVDEPPPTLADGGIFRRGAHPALDEIVDLALEGMGIIGRMEDAERARTGISSLKIRRNKVFGYYIEITRSHLHKVPADYMRKQTLTNGERYVTPELKELEEKVLGADERMKRLEHELFVGLRERMAAHSERLGALARRLAALDVLADLAHAAARHRWVRPDVDDTLAVDVVDGRHPVVEAMLDEERFVPNDVRLDPADRQLVVLTGPNMAGKSTIMRQVALIVLLAQVGSFVPATRARIGVCDRIFTRVGAADDLARGQSTFMVEMAETAAILHQATGRSLVLLDEIGRGTSTYDGLAIAWAVGEDLADRLRCRAIFATHYHELCDLAEARPAVVNQSIAVSESGDAIVFLRRLKEGGASRSYGIQCARLAGLPTHVVDRARGLLRRFEKAAPRNERQQLSLFGGGIPVDEQPEPEPPPDPIREALAGVDPDRLSPREAHDLLYRLRDLLG